MSFTPWRRRRPVLAGTGAIAIAVALSGCSSSTTTPTDAASTTVEFTGCEPATEPVNLEFWSWGVGYDEAVKLWNSENPKIQVKFSDIPVGNAGGYQKMFTAIKAGTAPDIGFLEFDTIPGFGSQGDLVDIAPFTTPALKSDFLAPFLAQASLGTEGAIFNAPLGGGPMALIYRKDLFDKHNLTPPATWDEFEALAATVHTIDPTATLSNFDGYGNANWFAGLASQAGAQWFAPEGDGWKVSLNDAPSRQTVDYWQGMLEDGTASDLATFSPEWSAALANGKIWSWPTAVWGAGVTKGSAPDTSGAWAVAPLPTWTADQNVSGSWGGGGLSVFKSSEHPCEAAQFALWMGTDPEAMEILNAAMGVYPTTSTLLADPMFTEPDPFFGGQRIFDVFLTSSKQLPDFTWGPAMTDTYTSLTDAMGKASSSGTSLMDALDDAQASVVSSMEKSGYTVAQ